MMELNNFGVRSATGSVNASPRVLPGSTSVEIKTMDSNNDDNDAYEAELAQRKLMLKTHEPKMQCCDCCGTSWILSKKTAVLMGAKLLLLLIMIGYIIYQLSKYFDDDINREEYTTEELVDKKPFFYIYFTYLIDDSDCNTTFGFYSDSTFNVTDYYDYFDITNTQDGYNMSVTDLFDYIDNDNECKGLYITKTEVGSLGTYINYLFIPSECDLLLANSKDFHFGALNCASPKDEPNDNLLWWAADHRAQLRGYETVRDVMYNLFWHECVYIRVGYDVLYSGRWIQFDNEIDDNGNDADYYDRYELMTDSMELTDYNENSSLIVTGTSILRFHGGNGVGNKYIYVTSRSMDMLDILGLAGGMYSSVDSTLSYLAFAAIWGFSFGIVKFSGVAKGAGPTTLMKAQLDAFLRTRDQAILALTERIQMLEANNNNNNTNNNDNNGSDNNNDNGNYIYNNNNNENNNTNNDHDNTAASNDNTSNALQQHMDLV